MSRFSRRGFIKTGVAGAAGAIGISPGISSSVVISGHSNLTCRTLGKTMLKVPVVSFGVTHSDNYALCKAAYDSGISLFDTGIGFHNKNNEITPESLFKDLPRNSFLISTRIKAAGIRSNGLPSNLTSSEDFLQKFNASLSGMGTDYVDILLLHDVTSPEYLEYKPIINTIQRLKKQRKARFIGVSTHSNMPEVIRAAADSEIWDVVLTSYSFKVDDIGGMNAALRKANNAGLGVIAMETLAEAGFLDKERKKSMNSTAALKWVLSNRDVHTTVPVITTFDHLNIARKVLEDIALTEEEKNDLLMAGNDAGLFCAGCTQCLPSCNFSLPVPDLMRAYMYAYSFSSLPMAYSILGELGTGSSPCINCESCKIECNKEFNVKEKIADISRLVNVPPDFIF